MGKKDIRFPQAEVLERAVFGQAGIIIDNEGNIHRKEEMDGKATEVVRKRFIIEQAKRTKEVIEQLCAIKNVIELPGGYLSVLKSAEHIDGGHEPRKQNAVWYIACLSNQDKVQAEKVMKQAGCESFVLYYGIDECIECFKV